MPRYIVLHIQHTLSTVPTVVVQAALTSVGREKDQLVEQVQSLAGASREIDSLSQQLSTAKQQLQEAQVCVCVCVALSKVHIQYLTSCV